MNGSITHNLETTLLTTMDRIYSIKGAKQFGIEKIKRTNYLCKTEANFKCGKSTVSFLMSERNKGSTNECFNFCLYIILWRYITLNYNSYTKNYLMLMSLHLYLGKLIKAILEIKRSILKF